MQTNTKFKAKSCSCQHCKAGKATKSGQHEMQSDERAVRRQIKSLLKALDEDYESEYDLLHVHKGNYYD